MSQQTTAVITNNDKCKFDAVVLAASLEEIITLFRTAGYEDSRLILNTCLHYRIFSIMPEIVIRDHFYTTELLRLAPLDIFIKCNMPIDPKKYARDYILCLARNTVDFEEKINYIRQEFIKAGIDYIRLLVSMITDKSHTFHKNEYTKRMTTIFSALIDSGDSHTKSNMINTLGSQYSEVIRFCSKYLDVPECINVLKNAVHMNNYLSFAVILNQSASQFSSADIIDIYYYTVSFGSEKMVAKMQKIFGGHTLRTVFYEYRECQEILVKIAERGSVSLFEHVTKYWTDLKNNFMNIDRMTSHAAYNGHIHFLDYMLHNLNVDHDKFYDIVLRKGLKSQNADSLLYVYRARPQLFLDNAPTEFIKKNIISRSTALQLY